MSSTQTLSPGGEPQLGRSRFSSPLTALVEVAHVGTHPIHMFSPPVGSPETLPISTRITLAGKGYSKGRCPVSRFRWMLNSPNLLRFSIHNGNSPDSRLCARNNTIRLDRLPSWDGIGPLSMLLWICSCVRLVRLPSCVGIDPVRLLPLRYSCVRLVRLPSCVGIDPLILLLLRFIVVRLDRLPSCVGIDPLILLLLRFIVVRLDRFPSWVGIDPVRLLLTMLRCVRLDRFPNSAGRLPFSSPGMMGIRFAVKLILVTRGGVPATVIPCQFDTAVVAFQLRVMVPRKVSFPAQRASQSATSPVLVVGLGTVVPFRHWVNVVCPETSNSNWPDTKRSANSIVAAPAAMPHRMGCPGEGG